jgi:hypothetical protein
MSLSEESQPKDESNLQHEWSPPSRVQRLIMGSVGLAGACTLISMWVGVIPRSREGKLRSQYQYEKLQTLGGQCLEQLITLKPKDIYTNTNSLVKKGSELQYDIACASAALLATGKDWTVPVDEFHLANAVLSSKVKKAMTEEGFRLKPLFSPDCTISGYGASPYDYSNHTPKEFAVKPTLDHERIKIDIPVAAGQPPHDEPNLLQNALLSGPFEPLPQIPCWEYPQIGHMDDETGEPQLKYVY